MQRHGDERPVRLEKRHIDEPLPRIVLEHREFLSLRRAEKILPLEQQHLAADQAHGLAPRKTRRREQRRVEPQQQGEGEDWGAEK